MRQTKRGLNGLHSIQPGNYRKGVWDTVSETALDTEASHSIAHSNLGLFEEADRRMDSHQEVGYAFVRVIAEQSPDPESRRAAQQALVAFGQAEIWESINERNVSDGHGAVIRARSSNHAVIDLAEANRRAAATAQRNGECSGCGEVA